jgi:hypothetical protein
MKKMIPLAIILLASTLAFSQKKVEREFGISPKQVHPLAISFVDSLAPTGKVKWFEETGLEKTTIEAKTKLNGKIYSIEFGQNGQLEDVEEMAQMSDLAQELKIKIVETLDSTYRKYHVDKIQIQYSGSRESLFLQLSTGKSTAKIRYELVVSARVEKAFRTFEFLFSPNGVMIQKSEIVQKNTDHLVF